MKHTVGIASGGVTNVPQTGYEEYTLVEYNAM
jgi:hypothetical protein